MRTRRSIMRLASWAAVVLGVAGSAACTDALVGPKPELELGQLVLSMSPPSYVAFIVAEVTGPGIQDTLRWTIPASAEPIRDTLSIPAGADRHVVVSAFDSAGIATHRGDTTISIRPGLNPQLRLVLRALNGRLPIIITFGEPEGGIAFESERDGNVDVFVIQPDGSGERRLTSHPAGDGAPSWSPDGTWIAFVSNRSGNTDIFVIRADRPEGPDNVAVQLTTSPGEDLWPQWSPDGTRIAFYSTRDSGNREIYVMNADGTAQTRLTTDAAADRSPTWSPDGLRIAFSSERSGGRRIFVMNADGSNPVDLGGVGFNDHPSWSPDGSQIAFISDRDLTLTFDVYVMNADGTSPTRLTTQAGDDVVAINPWSPDGRRLVFWSNRTGTSQLYVMNRDGSAAQAITAHPSGAAAPSWSRR